MMREKGKTAVIALLAVLLAACVSLSVLFLPVQAATIESFAYNFNLSLSKENGMYVSNEASETIVGTSGTIQFKNDYGKGTGDSIVSTKVFA